MTRVGFLLIALVTCILWAASLPLLAPALSARAVDSATRQVMSASATVALKIESRRVELQRALLKVSGSALAFGAFELGPKAEPPTAERLATLRSAIADELSASLKAGAIVALVNDSGGLWARGDQAPSAPGAELDLARLASAGSHGTALTAFGATHLFFSIPVVVPEKSGLRSLGAIIVGAPVLPEGMAESVAAEGGLSALAIFEGATLQQAGGAEKASAELIAKTVKLGTVGVLARGNLSAVGPFRFPLATFGDSLGGSAPLSIGLHQALEASPFQVVASVSIAPFMQVLAQYQKAGALAVVGLVLLSAALALLLGGKARLVAKRQEEPNAEPATPSAVTSPVRPQSVRPAWARPELAQAPEVSPDDFNFPSPSSVGPPTLAPIDPQPVFESEPPTPDDDGSLTPFDSPPPLTEPSPAAQPGDLDAVFTVPPPTYSAFESQTGSASSAAARTRAAPAYVPEPPPQPSGLDEADPFGMASPEEPEAPPANDYNPDATRVAAIPAELLKAARSSNTTNEAFKPSSNRATASMPSVPAVAIQPAGASADEVHFQEVYRDFVATRQRCGEMADGLTLEKFLVKLRKTREQLMAKHSCRSVRFQVYVKDEKAALKATPIKD